MLLLKGTYAKKYSAYIQLNYYFPSDKRLDMKIFQPEKYKSLYDDISLTATQIEDMIKHYQLIFSQLRIRSVEWETQFPMFVPIFYRLIITNQNIPDQQEFWTAYKVENKEIVSGYNEKTISALQARVYRTYPSLVRDVHFGLFLKKRLPECKIVYNIDLDIKEGIDLMIIHNNRYWAINLYINSSRAQIGRNVKEKRHIKFENVKYIELPASHKKNKIGMFYLYGCDEFNLIKSTLSLP